MALVRLLRGGQVTLPAELRQKLQVKEGDYLEAEVVENGMLLKPVAFVSRGAGLEGDPGGAAERTLHRPRAATQSQDEEEQIYKIVRGVSRGPLDRAVLNSSVLVSERPHHTPTAPRAPFSAAERQVFGLAREDTRGSPQGSRAIGTR